MQQQPDSQLWRVTVLTNEEQSLCASWLRVETQAQRTWEARQQEIDQLRADSVGHARDYLELQEERDQLQAEVAKLRKALSGVDALAGEQNAHLTLIHAILQKVLAETKP